MSKIKAKTISKLMFQFQAHVLLIYELIEELIINNQLNIKQLQRINLIRENLIYLLNLQNQFIITSRIEGKQVDNLLPEKKTFKRNKKASDNSESGLILNQNEIRIYLKDRQFLDLAMEVVEKHFSENKFDVSAFSKEMNMSRSSLSRKLHTLTDRSPLNFIRLIRIKKAARLLKQNNGNISEVAIEVGYTNPSYFARCFKKVFGVCPHVYQSNICKSVHPHPNYSKSEIFS